MKKRDVIDAKFEVVRGPEGKPPKRPPWFDWRNFLIVGGLTLMAVAAHVLNGLLT